MKMNAKIPQGAKYQTFIFAGSVIQLCRAMTGAQGRRKNVCPKIHLLTYFSIVNVFPRTLKVVEKTTEKLKSRCIKTHKIILNFNILFY